MSERRACRLIKADRKAARSRSRRPHDEELRHRLRKLAAEQRRFGYRRLHVLLRAEDHAVNRKKTQRLYREEGLTVRKRKGRSAPRGLARRSLSKRNARCSVDFVHDQLSDGRRFRILNVIDDVTKECLAALADASISGRRVAAHSTPSSPGAAGLTGSSPIMGPSLPQMQCSPGRRGAGSPDISSRRASGCRTGYANRSTGSAVQVKGCDC